MKTKLCTAGILMSLSLMTLLGEDKQPEPSTTGIAKTEALKQESLSAAWQEKVARQIIWDKSSADRIAGKRFVFSGPLVALVKSDNPLRTFNPFAVSNSNVPRDNFRRDPYLPPLRGFTLFHLEF